MSFEFFWIKKIEAVEKEFKKKKQSSVDDLHEPRDDRSIEKNNVGFAAKFVQLTQRNR